jgi:hypothetical protein
MVSTSIVMSTGRKRKALWQTVERQERRARSGTAVSDSHPNRCDGLHMTFSLRWLDQRVNGCRHIDVLTLSYPLVSGCRVPRRDSASRIGRRVKVVELPSVSSIRLRIDARSPAVVAIAARAYRKIA